MNEKVARDGGRTMVRVAAVAFVALCIAACDRKPDLATARPVMEKFLQAEREHRGSHGNYWRDRQPRVDRDEAMKNLGVDLSEAADFEFTIEPREDGSDTALRITATGRGAASKVSLSCVQKGQEPKADCKENAGAS